MEYTNDQVKLCLMYQNVHTLKNIEQYTLDSLFLKLIQSENFKPLDDILMKQVDSARFGETEGMLVEFDKGLNMFPSINNYILINPNSDNGILWLQAVDNGQIAIPILPAWLLKKDLKRGDYYIVNMGPNPKSMTINFKTPISIHNGKGEQNMIPKESSEVYFFEMSEALKDKISKKEYL